MQGGMGQPQHWRCTVTGPRLRKKLTRLLRCRMSRENIPCAVVDWPAYFRFDVPSVDLPEGGTSKLLQAS